MIVSPVTMEIGSVIISTTSNGGHPPEFFAERIVARLIAVADTAPEPIKAQAIEYREKMLVVVLDGLKRAIASDRANQDRMMLERGK